MNLNKEWLNCERVHEFCRTCHYRRLFSGTKMTRSSSYCNYMDETGELRDCYPWQCKELGKYKRKKKEQRKKRNPYYG